MPPNEYLPIIEILEEIFGESKMHNQLKGQISFDCPVCSYEIKGLERGDGKGNLEINYKQSVFKCWSCSETNDTHGGLYKLIKKYANKRQIKKYELLKPKDIIEPKNVIIKKIKLPDEYISLKNVTNGFKLTPHYRQAISYLRKRNITDEIIYKFNIGFCYSGEYSNRVIIPSYDVNQEVNYFIARSYLHNTRIKYKNPQAQKENIIFNEFYVKWHEPIYLVEGVFDSIFLNNSIPLLGKYVSEFLFEKLYEKADKIIIVLDGDAWDDVEKLYHKLNCGKLMGKVWTIKLPKDKDIADLQGDLKNLEIKKLD